jgi:hypothetical protein
MTRREIPTPHHHKTSWQRFNRAVFHPEWGSKLHLIAMHKLGLSYQQATGWQQADTVT